MIQKASWLVLLAAACGGGGGNEETAKNPSSGDCPPGMVKEGGECTAPPNQSGPASGSGSGSATGSGSGSASNSGSGSGSGSATPPGDKTPYDKDQVNIVLNRASNQVKNNCGSATDENGKAAGPWGNVKVTVTLGRNGHVHGVAVPDPYNGKPVGTCIEHAFQYLIFPPYAAPADVTVDRDVELHPPGSK